jgi:hypothetical protein
MPITQARARAGVPYTVDGKATCPAGRLIGLTRYGSACLCRVLMRERPPGKYDERTRSDEVITTSFDPVTLVGLCMGHYTECPVWRAEKEAIRTGTTLQEVWAAEDAERERLNAIAREQS